MMEASQSVEHHLFMRADWVDFWHSLRYKSLLFVFTYMIGPSVGWSPLISIEIARDGPNGLRDKINSWYLVVLIVNL